MNNKGISSCQFFQWIVYFSSFASGTIKGEGDTQLESEAQLYSDISIDLKIMQVKECKVIRPTK